MGIRWRTRWTTRSSSSGPGAAFNFAERTDEVVKRATPFAQSAIDVWTYRQVESMVGCPRDVQNWNAVGFGESQSVSRVRDLSTMDRYDDSG